MNIKLILFIFLLKFGLHSMCSNQTNQSGLISCAANFTDLLIVMDTSTSLTRIEFDSAKLNVINMILKFNLNTENMSIALMTFADRVSLLVPFNSKPTNSTDLLVNKINLFAQQEDKSLLSRAIHYSLLFVLNSFRMRPAMNTKKIVLVYTHGNHSEFEMRVVRKEASLLKRSSDLIMVRVGKNFNLNRFKPVATCPEYLIGFDQVYDLIKKVKANGC